MSVCVILSGQSNLVSALIIIKKGEEEESTFMLQGLSGNVFKGLDCVCVVLCAGIIARVLAHVTG